MARTLRMKKSLKRLSRKHKKSTRKHKKITRRSRKSHPLKRHLRKQSGGGSIDIMEPANLYDVYGKKVNEVAVSHTMLGQDDPDF